MSRRTKLLMCMVVALAPCGAASAFEASSRDAQAQDAALAGVLAKCTSPDAAPSDASAGIEPHHVILNPVIFVRPDAAAVKAAYPSAARRAHVQGRSKVTCVVGVEGHPHDCAASDEMPTGLGFGEAAIAVAQTIRFVPKRIDCKPVDGAKFSMTFAFTP